MNRLHSAGRKLGLGRLAYRGWHRPLAELARSWREGGPVAAARWLRWCQGQSYDRVRTMDDATFRQLLAARPPP